MKYRLLNEVLIEWNQSSKDDSDNIFLKSEDIKRSFDKCFIYRVDKKDYIKIFDVNWPELEKYKDKVWINDKHVKINVEGWTYDEFEPGEYRVYIKDIDKVTDMAYMFFRCKQLVSGFIPDSVITIGDYAFYQCGLTSLIIPNSVTAINYCTLYGCKNLKTVYIEDINKFNQIKFEGVFSDPRCYRAKVIELKK